MAFMLPDRSSAGEVRDTVGMHTSSSEAFLQRLEAYREDALRWWEGDDQPAAVRSASWRALLDAYPDLPLEVKQYLAVRVGKRVSYSRRRQRDGPGEAIST